MSALRQAQLNESPCPIDERDLTDLNSSQPADAVSVAEQLPPLQRARLCQFCYEKAHLFELALRIASTCDERTLVAVFGNPGKIVFEQSRNLEDTLSMISKREAQLGPKPVSLPPIGSR